MVTFKKKGNVELYGNVSFGLRYLFGLYNSEFTFSG